MKGRDGWRASQRTPAARSAFLTLPPESARTQTRAANQACSPSGCQGGAVILLWEKRFGRATSRARTKAAARGSWRPTMRRRADLAGASRQKPRSPGRRHPLSECRSSGSTPNPLKWRTMSECRSLSEFGDSRGITDFTDFSALFATLSRPALEGRWKGVGSAAAWKDTP
jgi:hypothetical protein